jgi:uncharacterized membrane protein (DUF2068 family)
VKQNPTGPKWVVNMRSKRNHNKGLLAVAILKWIQGLLLLAIALGLLKLFHRDVGELLENLANNFRVDPNNRFFGGLLNKLDLLEDKKIGQLSAITMAYGLLFLIEGTGLFFEKRWAEYLTIIATASFIPVEVYELIKDFAGLKLFILILNTAIVVFLIVIVRTRREST